MTAHERMAQRAAIRKAAILTLSKRMADWADRPTDSWCELRATDAACQVWPEADDLHRVRNDMMHDLGLDSEGYPITDEGDRNWNADRRYVPMADKVGVV